MQKKSFGLWVIMLRSYRYLGYLLMTLPVVLLLVAMMMPSLRVVVLMDNHGGLSALQNKIFEMPTAWSNLHGASLKRKIQGEFRKHGVYLGVDKVSLQEDIELQDDANGALTQHCQKPGEAARVIVFIPFSMRVPLYGDVTFLECFLGRFGPVAQGGGSID